MNRRKNIYINSLAALIGQLLQILLSFVVRKIFIITLGVSYLGYNSVFSNILQMLNLADLGIGVAVTSFLYKPLAMGEKDRIATLMSLYRKIYHIMGMIVLSIGLIVSVFLGYIIPDATVSIWQLRILFYINLLGTVSTYFLAYKRTLIIADQKSYVANIIDTSIYFVITGIQIVSLLLFPNYIVFLTLSIAKTVISNLILSIKCNQMYGMIPHRPDRKLYNEYKPQLIQYVKDVFVSRIGAVVFYGTDNVIISIFHGSLLAGYLSNYTMITMHLATVIIQLLSSIQATFGNYINSNKTLDEQRTMSDNYLCANYILGNFSMICFVFLAQPFVKMYFGSDLMLSFSTVIWLGVNLLLQVLLQLPSQVFTIYKLFKRDKIIILISTSLNIIISAALVSLMGVDGALIGTFVTSLIYLFSRYYIITKYVYFVPYVQYIKKIFLYFGLSFFTFLITYIVCNRIEVTTWIQFIIQALLVACIAVAIPCFCLSFMPEFQFLTKKMIPLQKERYLKMLFAGITAIAICLAFIVGNGEPTTVTKLSNNKSDKRNDTYQLEQTNMKEKLFHFSIDDTIQCFEDITKRGCASIFDNATFAWLKDMHEKYGIVVSCFCFYEESNFNLTKVPEQYKDEFSGNSDWLRFGFHSKNINTTYDENKIIDDYIKTIKELERIAGKESIDNIIRLQSYKGNESNIAALKQIENQPILGLLTADDDRISYYLDKVDNEYIFCHDYYYDKEYDVLFISTDIRVENVDNIDEKLMEFYDSCWNNQMGVLEIFTHEWILDQDIKNKIEAFCKWADNEGYCNGFPEDKLIPQFSGR